MRSFRRNEVHKLIGIEIDSPQTEVVVGNSIRGVEGGIKHETVNDDLTILDEYRGVVFRGDANIDDAGTGQRIANGHVVLVGPAGVITVLKVNGGNLRRCRIDDDFGGQGQVVLSITHVACQVFHLGPHGVGTVGKGLDRNLPDTQPVVGVPVALVTVDVGLSCQNGTAAIVHVEPHAGIGFGTAGEGGRRDRRHVVPRYACVGIARQNRRAGGRWCIVQGDEQLFRLRDIARPIHGLDGQWVRTLGQDAEVRFHKIEVDRNQSEPIQDSVAAQVECRVKYQRTDNDGVPILDDEGVTQVCRHADIDDAHAGQLGGIADGHIIQVGPAGVVRVLQIDGWPLRCPRVNRETDGI